MKVRPYFYGDVYPLTQVSDRTDIWSAVQFDRPEQEDGIVQVFRRENAPYTEAEFRLGGIKSDCVYVFRDSDTGVESELSGNELLNEGFKVHIPDKRCAKIYFYTKKQII